MPKKKTLSVDDFLDVLEHSRKKEIELLRKLILKCSPHVTEQIKWNAPSFCFKGDDRVTMRLQPKDRVELVFHRGVKVKESRSFQFDDPSGLLDFKAPDRAVIALKNLEDVELKKKQLGGLIERWMIETSD